jgi:hypothetical protein
VFLYRIFIFLKKFEEKKIQKKVAKFLKNGFQVPSEQSRTKCFSKFETKPSPNPTQTEPNRTKPKRTGTVATLISTKVSVFHTL